MGFADVIKKILNSIFNTFRSSAGMKEREAPEGLPKGVLETRKLRAGTYIAMLDELKKILKLVEDPQSDIYKQIRDLAVYIAEELVDRSSKSLRVTHPELESAKFYQTKTGIKDRYDTLKKTLSKTNINEMKEPMKRINELVAQIKLAARLIQVEMTQRSEVLGKKEAA